MGLSDFEVMLPQEEESADAAQTPGFYKFESMLGEEEPSKTKVEPVVESPGILDTVKGWGNFLSNSLVGPGGPFYVSAGKKDVTEVPSKTLPKPEPIDFNIKYVNGQEFRIPIYDNEEMQAYEDSRSPIVRHTKKFVKGGYDATIGFAGTLLDEYYKLWKAGNIEDITKITSTLVSGGALTIDPSKSITEGGLESMSGKKINEAAKNMLDLDITSAVKNIAYAVPFFGPLGEEIQAKFEEGEYAEGLGVAAGFVVGAKLAHSIIGDEAIASASLKASKRYRSVATDTRQLEAQLEQTLDPSARRQIEMQVQKINGDNELAMRNIIHEEADRAIAKEMTSSKKKALDGMLRNYKKQLKASEVRRELGIPDTSKIDAEFAKQEGLTREVTEKTIVKPSLTSKAEIARATKSLKKKEAGLVKGAKIKTEVEEVPLKINGSDAELAERLYGKYWDGVLEDNPEAWKKGDLSELISDIEREMHDFDAMEERLLAKSDKVEGLSKVEEKTGKPLSELEPADVMEYLDDLELDDIITRLDRETGVKVPEEIASGNGSPFRVNDPGVVKAQANSYSKNKLVASNFNDLMNPELGKDPVPTTHKLLNDVNRWLDGESVEIAASRSFLSDLAARADEFKWRFIDEKGNLDTSFFNEWKEMTEEAAAWAKRTEQPTGSKLYSGIPLDEIYRRLVGFKADPVGGVADSWTITGPKGSNMEVTFKGGSAYVDQVRVPVNARGEGLGAKLYEKLGLMMRERGIAGDKIEGNIKGDLPHIEALRQKAADIAGEGREGADVYELDLGADAGGVSLYSGIPLDPEGKVIKLVTKGLRDFAKKFNEDVMKRAELAAEKANKYTGWKFSVGSRLKSSKTGKIYEVTGKLWDTKNDRPLYMFKGISDKSERGNFIAEIAHDTLVELAGPKKIDTFYSGIDPTRLKDLGKGIADHWKQSRESKKLTAKKVKRALRKDITQKWIHREGNARRALEQIGQDAYGVIQAQSLARGGHPRAVNTYRQARLEYRAGFSKAEKQIMDTLIMAKRVLAIDKTPSGKKMAYPEAFTPEKSADIIRAIGSKEVNGIADLTPEQVKRINRATEIYFDWGRKVVNDAYEAGLIGGTEREALVANDYFRLRPVNKPTVADLFDKRREVMIGGRPRSVYDSGIQSLAKGKPTDIFEMNSELMMLEQMNRMYNRVMSNKANRELQDFARSNPGNNLVRVKEPSVKMLPEQPESRTGLIKSIHIKKDIQGLSDYEYKGRIKEQFKVSSTKRLNLEQLKTLDNSLGENSYEYNPVIPEERIPRGWKRHYVYENGARKSIWLNPELSAEWLAMSSEMTGSFAKLIKYMSGAPIVRAFATGINPIFAVRNLPRDVMHAWFASRVMENGKWKSLYSPNPPKAIAQFSSDYADVLYDTIHRTGRYTEYIDEGGGMDFLVTQGNPLAKKGLKLESGFDRLYDVMSYLNETSELMTRLAVRERVIKRKAAERGITVEEARKDPLICREGTFAAADQMPFPEGGRYTKALDIAIPYLNARIVGTRSLFRSFKQPENWLKLAAFASLIGAAYIGNKKVNPETMKQLKDDPRARGNLIVPFGDKFGFQDENGDMRYPFFKIPIDQSQKFFKTLFERLIDKWIYSDEDVNWDSVGDALKETSPVDISSLPPLPNAIVGYYTNKDVWLGRDITPEPLPYERPTWLGGPEVGGSKEEYKEGNIEQFYLDVGGVTGLSPDRVKFALEEMITSDNIYSGVLFGVWGELRDKLPEAERQQTLMQALAEVPGIRSFYGLTNPNASLMDDVEKVEDRRTAIRLRENNMLDMLVGGYLNGGLPYSEVENYIESFDDHLTRERMYKDLRFQEDIKGLPHFRWWKALRRLDTQGRAEAYVARMQKADKAEIDQINSETDIVIDAGGVITKDFMNRVDDLLYGETY